MAVVRLLGAGYLFIAVTADCQCSNELSIDVDDTDTNERTLLDTVADDGSSALLGQGTSRRYLNHQHKLAAKVKNFVRRNKGRNHLMSISMNMDAVLQKTRMIKTRILQGAAAAHKTLSRWDRKVQKFSMKYFGAASSVGDVGFYAMQVMGLVKTFEALFAVGPDGAPSFDSTSMTGILTILSVPGQIFGTVAGPFLLFDTIRSGVGAKFGAYTRRIVASASRMVRAFKLPKRLARPAKLILSFANRRIRSISQAMKFQRISVRMRGVFARGGAKLASLTRKVVSLTRRTATVISRGLSRVTSLMAKASAWAMRPLAVLDVLLSMSSLADALEARDKNADPDYEAYFQYNVGMSATYLAISFVSLGLTFALAVIPAIAGVALLVLGIVSVFMWLFDQSSAKLLQAERVKRLRRYREAQILPCMSMNTEFFRYLVKIAREIEYLASGSFYAQQSSSFDIRRLSVNSDISEPYVHLSKLVVEEKKVISTLSSRFVKQLRDPTRGREIETQDRAVKVEKIILPSNMFLSVGTHECASRDIVSPCNVANVRRVLITKVRFLRSIDLKGWDDAANTAPDPYCSFWVRGIQRGRALVTRWDTRNPEWNPDIYLDLQKEVDGYLEGFDFECWDQDVMEDDKIGSSYIRLDSARNTIVYRSFGHEEHLLEGRVDVEFTYEIFGIDKTPHEWIPVPLTAIKDGCRYLRHEAHVSFISCEFKCDAFPICNARKYRSSTRACDLFHCDVSLPELDSVEAVEEAAYIRLESVNCGGYYARSCEDCDDHCFGQCTMSGDGCVKRSCDKCVFPFAEGTNVYWGCTKKSLSYPGVLKCATQVDRHWNAEAWADCDGTNRQCKQLCATYYCLAGWTKDPTTECHGDCTDAQCCHTTRRALRKISVDQATLYDVPQKTRKTDLDRWIAEGENHLVVDKNCVGVRLGGNANNESLINSRVHLPAIGQSSMRKLEIIVNKDNLTLQSENIILPNAPTGFYELAPLRIYYDIKLNGQYGTNDTDHMLLNGESLQPLRYTLTIPGFDFGRDTPIHRTSSFSYTLHKTNVRDTYVFLQFPAYTALRLAGFTWHGQYGIYQSCIEPFAKPLHEVKPKWQMRLMSSYPTRSVIRYRTIEMGSVVNDRIAFFVQRGTHTCRVNHIKKTYMLEAISANDPTQQAWWQARERYYKYNEAGKRMHREVKFNHTTFLATILETLEDYRNSAVAGFTREERPVQVLLGKANHATFYFNGASGWRTWTIFVPRVRRQSLHMNFQVASLDDSPFQSHQMNSYNMLPGMINVTYMFPQLGHTLLRQAAGLVTLLLPFTGNPKVTKVTCPVCTVRVVKDVLQAALSDMIIDFQEVRIINTHRYLLTSVEPRERPLVMYTTPEMRDNRYFPHDDPKLLALGYFESAGGDGCAMAKKVVQSGVFTLYRAFPVYEGDVAHNLTLLSIPNPLVRTKTSSKHFRDIFVSRIPACAGVVAVFSDSTRYCITCSVVSILESYGHASLPMAGAYWAFLDDGREDQSSAALTVFQPPRLTFLTQDKAEENGYQGLLQYQDWTFRVPDGFADSSVDAQAPSFADSAEGWRYFFDGLVRIDPVGDARVFALWSPTNPEDGTPSVICDHNSLGDGHCTTVTEDVERMESIDETRIVESGVGTWVIYPVRTGALYEFAVDRVIADDDIQRKSALFPTLLFQRNGTLEYAHRGCEFELAGNVSLLSRGAAQYNARSAPLAFLMHNDFVASLYRDCTVKTSTNMRLGELMTSHAWIAESLHLNVTLPSDDEPMTIPRVSGYSTLSVSFHEIGDRNISIALGAEWEEDAGQEDVAFFVEERINHVEVRHQDKSIFLSNGTAQQLNAQVSVEVVRIPDAVSEVDEIRKKNIKTLETFLLYRAYQPTIIAEPTDNCRYSCSNSEMCLPNGSCVAHGSLFSQLLPVWRQHTIPSSMPKDVYCFQDHYYQRCANLHEFYTYVARTVVLNDTLVKLGDGVVLHTSFGAVTFCTTDACANSAAEKILSDFRISLRASTFVLKLVSANSTSARMALWPNFERNSSRGSGGAALIEIAPKDTDPCGRMRSIPEYARNLARKDPNGFGRLIEQVYFEVMLNSASPDAEDHACIRVSSAYAASATNGYWTLGDSISHLSQLGQPRHLLSCGASKEVFSEPRYSGASLLSANFTVGGEAMVDMRLSSVFTLIESLITFVNVAKEQEWNLSAIKQKDLLWSLFQDGDFPYFERFGGITLRNWPENVDGPGILGPWSGTLDEGQPVVGPLLKRMLEVLPQYKNPGPKPHALSALQELSGWSNVVEHDFTYENSMKNAIGYWQKLKSNFPKIGHCTTPIDPKFSARRYVCNQYGHATYTLLSVRQTRVGKYRLSAPNDKGLDEGMAEPDEAIRIDDSCDEYVVVLAVCSGSNRNATKIEVRYNGVDWYPEVEWSILRIVCEKSAPQDDRVTPPSLQWSTFHPKKTVEVAPTQLKFVRVKIKDTDSLCAMSNAQDPHIRAVQRYDIFSDFFADGYMGSFDPRYRLRFNNVSGFWGLYYRAKNSDVIIVQWNNTRVNDIVGTASGPFIVENPLYANPLEADVTASRHCLSNTALPSAVPSEVEPPMSQPTPQPSCALEQCGTFVKVATSYTCDEESIFLRRLHRSVATKCEAECARDVHCKYYTQYSDGSCPLWTTCSRMVHVNDLNATIFAKTVDEGSTSSWENFNGEYANTECRHMGRSSEQHRNGCKAVCDANPPCNAISFNQETKVCILRQCNGVIGPIGDEPSEGFTASRLIAHWEEVFKCGDNFDAFNRLYSFALSVRICSLSGETGCVESSSTMSETLRTTGKLYSDTSCDESCVKTKWIGPHNLLSRLTYSHGQHSPDHLYNAPGLFIRQDECQWMKFEQHDIPVQIQFLLKPCTQPKYTVGYDLAKAVADLKVMSFDVYNVQCKDGYEGSPSAELCSSPGGEYTLSNCTAVCVQPRDTTGYDLRGVTDQDLRLHTFHIDGVRCQNGYVGIPSVKRCEKAGHEYAISGCRADAFWATVFKCGHNSISENLLALAKHVSICSKDSDHCVYSKTDVPLEHLRNIASLHSQSDHTCNLDCVKNDWWAKDGDQHLLNYLTHYCNERGLFYGACETKVDRLHMGLGSSGSLWPQFYRGNACTWSLAASSQHVEMRFLLPPAMYDEFQLEKMCSHDSDFKKLGSFGDVQECANRCMQSHGCQYFYFNKLGDCVQTRGCTHSAYDSYRLRGLSCPSFKTIEMCVSSTDGRPEYFGLPCAWCCGRKCWGDGGEKCEVEQSLMSSSAKRKRASSEYITKTISTCTGRSRSPYVKLWSRYECASRNILLAPKTDLSTCGMHCAISSGCKYFIFSQRGRESGKCFRETTEGATCLEGWRKSNYDFYMLTEDIDCVRRNEGLSQLTSKQTMVANGWTFMHFSSDDMGHAEVREFCGKGKTWFGYSGLANVGTLRAKLSGSCSAVLRFRNCWDSGIVKVYLSGRLLSESSPKANARVTFHFNDGDMLDIKDEGANSVIYLQSLDFVTPSVPYSRIRRRHVCTGTRKHLSDAANAQECANICSSVYKCRYFSFGSGCYQEYTDGACNLQQHSSLDFYMLGHAASSAGNHLKCTFSRKVVPMSNWCDEYNNCGDFSDEAWCDATDGQWSSWGVCHSPCRKGTHYRTCTNPKPTYGGAPCSGHHYAQCGYDCAPLCKCIWKSNKHIENEHPDANNANTDCACWPHEWR